MPGLRTFLATFRAYAGRRLWSALVLVAVGAVIEGLGLILLLPIADILLQTGQAPLPFATIFRAWLSAIGLVTPAEQVVALCIPLLVYFAARAVILFSRDRTLADLQSGFVNYMRRRLFENLVRSDWTVVKTLRRSDLLDGLTMDVTRVAAGVSILMRSGVSLTLLFAYLAMAVLASPPLGAALLGLLAATACAAFFKIRGSGEQGRNVSAASRLLMGETHSFLTGLKLAKIYRAEDAFLERYQGVLDRWRGNQVAFAAGQVRFQRAVEGAAALLLLAVLLVGKLVLEAPGPALILLAAALLWLTPLVVGLVNQVQQLAFVMPAFVGVEALRKKSAPSDTARERVSEPLPVGAVRFENVGYEVDSGGEAPAVILRNVTLTLPACGFVAVEGPSGAGKSTLVELLAGLLPATSGAISVGDVPIDSADGRRRLSRTVAFAPQEPFLFDASLRANLAWPDATVGEAEIRRALAASDSDGFVRALPSGLDAVLGEHGMRLSGGERQRVCLARLLLRPAHILILDEATSALDLESERRILESLSVIAREKLVIVVTHRATARRYADAVLRVDAGQVTLSAGEPRDVGTVTIASRVALPR